MGAEARRATWAPVAVLAAALALCGGTDASAQARRDSKPVLASAKPTRAVEVRFDYGYPTGSIVIVNSERKLYYILGNGRALRYGVAIGSEFEIWTGRTFVSAKKEDPWWYPVDGLDPVPGGDPANPLGKRALYLDWSLLRIHGTPSRGSIGRAVSNGCIRMLDEDVMDLYERIHIGAPVIAIASLDDAGKFSEAKFTGKLQDFVTEDGGSADYGAGSWGREDWGRERRGRAWGSDRWSDAEERWSGGRSWRQRRDRW